MPDGLDDRCMTCAMRSVPSLDPHFSQARIGAQGTQGASAAHLQFLLPRRGGLCLAGFQPRGQLQLQLVRTVSAGEHPKLTI